MNAVPQRVLKLVLEDDTCPIDVWLQSLRDKTTRARIIRQIDRMERGNFGDHKDVGKGVSELRLFFGAGYRVYYAVVASAIVVLLGGSDKASQSAAISRAQQLWAEFQQQGASETALQSWSSIKPAETTPETVIEEQTEAKQTEEDKQIKKGDENETEEF